MIKLQDRVILKTLDGKIIVRPQVTEHTATILTPHDNVVMLNEEGVKAWNSGEDLKPWHVLCAHPRAILEGILF